MKEKYNFRIKIMPNKRAVSFRGIECIKRGNSLFVTQKGVRPFIRQYFRSMHKDIYKEVKFNFYYSKSKNKLVIRVYSTTSQQQEIIQEFIQNILYNAFPEINGDSAVVFKEYGIKLIFGWTQKDKEQKDKEQEDKEQEDEEQEDEEQEDEEQEEEEQEEEEQEDEEQEEEEQNKKNSKKENHKYEASNILSMVRILTEQEFELSYGQNWKEIVDWDDDMATLFGKELDSREVKMLMSGKDVEITDSRGSDYFINLLMTTKNLSKKYANYTRKDFRTLFDGLDILENDFGSTEAKREKDAIVIYTKNNLNDIPKD